jgi:nucleoside 2-deoxyribosyltransferase
MRPRVYLAGPDVFFPDASEIAKRKKEICAEFGLEGLSPFDNEVEVDARNPRDAARRIYSENVQLMETANAVIANLTPFRGVSADVGTAFELGFCAARGLPLFGYSEDRDGYVERVRGAHGLSGDALTDAKGSHIENMGHPDNLMLLESIWQSGGAFFSPHNHPDLFGKFELFRYCANAVAEFARSGRRAAG